MFKIYNLYLLTCQMMNVVEVLLFNLYFDLYTCNKPNSQFKVELNFTLITRQVIASCTACIQAILPAFNTHLLNN